MMLTWPILRRQQAWHLVQPGGYAQALALALVPLSAPLPPLPPVLKTTRFVLRRGSSQPGRAFSWHHSVVSAASLEVAVCLLGYPAGSLGLPWLGEPSLCLWEAVINIRTDKSNYVNLLSLWNQ